VTSERTGSPETASLDVSVRPGPIVTISGEIDIQSGPQLRDQLLSIIRRHSARLVLDLTGVTFIDCAGINVLLAARRRAQLEGGSLRVLRASPRVQRVIALARLHHVLMPTTLPDVAASWGSIGRDHLPEFLPGPQTFRQPGIHAPSVTW
jgi:anti-anti-sigma factor